MADKNLLDELDSLIKRASEVKEEGLKKEGQDGGISAKIDNSDDGTSPATTGEQASSQISAQDKMYPDNMTDTGAKDNEAGASVEMSTDGATAVSPDGEEGTQGGIMEPKKEADNGEEKPENKVDGNGGATGAFKSAEAEDLRKLAAELEEAAEGLLTPLDRFLVKAARANEDEQVVKVAEAMDDAALADAAAGTLLEQIEGGELGEEEAAAILEEAVEAGAVTDEELQEAAAAVGGMEGAPEAAAGDMAAPEEMAMSEDIEAAPEIANLDAKLAAAEIGPDHEDYLKKLASLYPEDIQAGYAFGLKLAEELAEADSSGDDEEEGGDDEGGEEGGDDAIAEATEEAAEGAAEGAAEAAAEAIGGEEAPAEEAPPAEIAPDVAPVEEVPVEGAPAGIEELAPESPEEAEALAAVQEELGLDDAALAQLMAQEVPMMDKVAEAKAKYRSLIYKKVAALRQ